MFGEVIEVNNALSKINIIPIVKSYLLNFKIYQSNKYSKGSLIIFFFLPLLVAVLLPVFGITVNNDLSTLLLALYSIFAGLFFSFQIFIFEILSKIVELNLNLQSSRLRINKFEYIASSISFAILVCFMGIFVLLPLAILGFNSWAKLILSGVSFYFLTLFVLSLLMSLRGIHILLTEEIIIQRSAVEEKFNKNSNPES